MPSPEDFGDKFKSGEIQFPVPPDNEESPRPPPVSASPEKWTTSNSDLIAIGGVALAVVLWFAQPGWRIGLPIAGLIIGLFIFSAWRHRGPVIIRIIATIAAIAIFVFFIWQPMWESIQKDFFPKNTASLLDSAIELDCKWSRLLRIAPSNPIGELELNSSFPADGGAYLGFSQQPNEPLSMESPDAPDYAWRCRFSNFGKEAVLQVEADITARFLSIIKMKDGLHSGGLIKTTTPHMIPFTLEGGTGKFDLYIRNYSTDAFAEVILPTTARGIMAGSEQRQSFKLSLGMFHSFSLPPFQRKIAH